MFYIITICGGSGHISEVICPFFENIHYIFGKICICEVRKINNKRKMEKVR